MELIHSLLEQLCILVVIAYLLSKSILFMPIISLSHSAPSKLACYSVFSLLAILGTYLGLDIDGAIANTRSIGAILGGLLGGPIVGFFVGLTAGIQRYSLGGFSSLACATSTTLAGLLSGFVYQYYYKRNRSFDILKPQLVFILTAALEALQMLLILIIAQPFDLAWELVQDIALPMIICNAIGASLFIRMFNDQKAIYEQSSVAFNSRALRIAHRSVGILNSGFNTENCQRIANIIHQESGVGAVSITNETQLLAFVGMGTDHHIVGTAITSSLTKQVIETGEVIFADGKQIPFQCSVSDNCQLRRALIIPLTNGSGDVIGTIKLYEPKHRLFSVLNITLGEGLAKLLSNQILESHYIQQQQLLNLSEKRLLQAQINPHFLFNALNVISSITRRDPEKARELIRHLSTFFRKNLKQNVEFVSLEEELSHVDAYLQIEQARFSDRLKVVNSIDESLLTQRIPTFTLQPLVENAIKHGVAHMFDDAIIEISAYQKQEILYLTVQDNAGLYEQGSKLSGIGTRIVDQRIKIEYGSEYGLNIEVEPELWTRATCKLPI